MSSLIMSMVRGFVFCVILASGVSALAEPITVEIVGFEAGTNPSEGQGFTSSFEAGPDGLFLFERDQQPAGTVWQLNDLTVSGDIDPVAALGFAVTNVTAGDIEFIMTVTVPISPTLPSTLYGGSASFTVNNSNVDAGATLSSNLAGDPLYAGLIDGSPILPLLAAPFSLTTASADTVTDFAGLSLGGPTIPGPGATTIGIEVRFSLSAGDSATGTSNFIVLIPEPTSAMLLVVGMGLLSARRR